MSLRRYDYYDGVSPFTSLSQDNVNDWAAQTFEASNSYTAKSISFWQARTVGQDIGTVTVSIKAVDGSGHPIGVDLAFGTKNSADIPELGSGYEWINFDLGTGLSLTKGTDYAIVIRASNAASGRILYNNFEISDGYGGGNFEWSTTGGSSWNAQAGDLIFRVYAESTVEIYEGNTNWSSAVICYEEYYEGQSFTSGVDFTLIDMQWRMYRTGSPGTMTINLYATDGSGKPTGASLAVGTTNANTLTTDTVGEWRTIVFSSSYEIQAGVKYAFISSMSGGDASNKVDMLSDSTSPTFSEGNRLYSWDYGSSWSVLTGSDMTFRAWGTGTLIHYYNTGHDSEDLINSSVQWRAQTFTPDVSFTAALLRLKFTYRSASPGDMTVSIKATDGSGHPIGADLITEIINVNAVPSDIAGEWVEITLDPDLELTQGIKYAIVCRALTSDGGNTISWALDTSAGYSGGNREYSGDSGSSWSSDTTKDFQFELYESEDIVPEITDQSSSSSSTIGTRVDLFVTATGEPTPTYQWYADGSPISGEISSIMTVYPLVTTTYKCEVSNIVGIVWTDNMIITITPNPYRYNPYNVPLDSERIT